MYSLFLYLLYVFLKIILCYYHIQLLQRRGCFPPLSPDYAVIAFRLVEPAWSLLVPVSAASTLGHSLSNVIGIFVSIQFAIDFSSCILCSSSGIAFLTPSLSHS